jgi:hypothetical protein
MGRGTARSTAGLQSHMPALVGSRQEQEQKQNRWGKEKANPPRWRRRVAQCTLDIADSFIEGMTINIKV